MVFIVTSNRDIDHRSILKQSKSQDGISTWIEFCTEYCYQGAVNYLCSTCPVTGTQNPTSTMLQASTFDENKGTKMIRFAIKSLKKQKQATFQPANRTPSAKPPSTPTDSIPDQYPAMRQTNNTSALLNGVASMLEDIDDSDVNDGILCVLQSSLYFKTYTIYYTLYQIVGL